MLTVKLNNIVLPLFLNLTLHPPACTNFKLPVAPFTPHHPPLNALAINAPWRYEGLYENALVGRAQVLRTNSPSRFQVRIGTVGSALMALHSAESPLHFDMKFHGPTWYMDKAIGWGVLLSEQQRACQFVEGGGDGEMEALKFGWMLFKNQVAVPMEEQLVFRRIHD